jgi:MFS family permease
MHHRPPERSERRIVPRQLGTTLEVDDGIARIGRARGVRRSGSAPLVGARAAMRRVFMVFLAETITIVALPSIGAGVRFSEQGLQWMLSACALTFGGLLLLGGRAADLLGRWRAFMAGAVFFTTASLLCGLAWSPAALLTARVVQGAGAAIMTPTALSK